ncbi:MAG: hypothetical protein IT379_38660, partial [Deltaproteobacteria bacterium]|nr:hypothetical protein [Deltaproteobacteria bacterium]
DPGAQTGCAMGQSCDIIESGGLICRPLGTGGDGSSCSNGLDCIAGYGCISAGGPAECRRLCCMSIDTPCPSGQRCLASVGGPDSPYMACFPAGCDPVEDVGCPADQTCYPRNDTGDTICLQPAGTGRQGDACPDGNVNDCAQGHICIENRCVKMCRFGGGEPSCGPGLRCLLFGDFAILGVCMT